MRNAKLGHKHCENESQYLSAPEIVGALFLTGSFSYPWDAHRNREANDAQRRERNWLILPV
jgi:hypothetical protein